MIRLRYREAAEIIKIRGRMAVLVINDIDAGAGRFDRGTQYTVNTQLVNATLMNIADNPTNVQLPGSYDSTPLPRIPIILTGNDLSTLYAPLVRDGRMEKFYWVPTREDKIGIVSGIFAPDNISQREVSDLVAKFPDQAVDFFAAMRARIYDEQIREFIQQVGLDRIAMEVVNPAGNPPTFTKPNFTISRLIEFGNILVQEQKSVSEGRLVEEYNRVRYEQPPITTNRLPTAHP
jgi:ATPase family associated with various cellular activities (AAA)